MQFVLFSSPTNFDEEIELINYFLKEDNLIFHLRKPDLSFKELKYFIGKIPNKYHSKIVIHQYINLLNEYNLRGYHCTRFFLENSENDFQNYKIQYSKMSFSRSCHSIEELKDIKEFDYVFLSPVFNSISKLNYKSTFIIDEVNEDLKHLQTPVYALGGISDLVINKIKNSSFKGFGVLGYIWNADNPKENYNKLKKTLLFD